jgi:hypothetical protein
MSTLSKLLVTIARRGQYGHSRTPRTFYMGDGYCEYYWSSSNRDVTFEQWQKIAKLSKRYHRYVHYVEEVLPAWKTVENVYYADNSIEAVQRDRHGRTRQVMTKAPGGDACF